MRSCAQSLYKYFNKPGMLSLAGGLPPPDYFPYVSLKSLCVWAYVLLPPPARPRPDSLPLGRKSAVLTKSFRHRDLFPGNDHSAYARAQLVQDDRARVRRVAVELAGRRREEDGRVVDPQVGRGQVARAAQLGVPVRCVLCRGGSPATPKLTCDSRMQAPPRACRPSPSSSTTLPPACTARRRPISASSSTPARRTHGARLSRLCATRAMASSPRSGPIRAPKCFSFP